MKLLFKREQTTGTVGGVQFKLWAKIELDEAEEKLVQRYRFAESVLIFGPEPKLVRMSILLGALAGFVAYILLGALLPDSIALAAAVIAWAGAGYWWYNQKREKLFVKDLLHGRTFVCAGIIELTKKEAWLHGISVLLRQVIETAKHWGGTETNDIPVLSREEAKDVVIQFG
ncbi:MAG: hypothetical protein AAFY84_16490 [Pseudomonadota bacterium]